MQCAVSNSVTTALEPLCRHEDVGPIFSVFWFPLKQTYLMPTDWAQTNSQFPASYIGSDILHAITWCHAQLTGVLEITEGPLLVNNCCCNYQLISVWLCVCVCVCVCVHVCVCVYICVPRACLCVVKLRRGSQWSATAMIMPALLVCISLGVTVFRFHWCSNCLQFMNTANPSHVTQCT